MPKKVVQFPTYNVSLGDAVRIMSYHLYDENIALPTKLIAIEKVINMETHNSVSKDRLIHALRWLFEHYDFEGE